MSKTKKGLALDTDTALQLLAALLREAEDVAALRARARRRPVAPCVPSFVDDLHVRLRGRRSLRER
ncbi:MAG TPA: hypothetical protein VM580_22495 [Labilithrix sp.]|nr:hypothetical protein [Labilithrix sp.]